MHRLGFLLTVSILTAATGSYAAEPDSCRTVRIADGQWTDNVAQNGLAEVILTPLGYSVRFELLAAPQIFMTLKTKDIDVFFNAWSPSVDSMAGPYLQDGSIERLVDNMTGAKWTLAVPSYVYDGGLKNFADIAKFKEKLGGKIFGIEPGNDANQSIQKMIKENSFGLGDFDLVESSETAMLSQVERSVRSNDWVVFMGWAPHPMNTRFDMRYLDGGDAYFGPEQGGATVWTAVRAGYARECPNLGKFFTNLKFTVEMENMLMGYILEEGLDGPAAARKYLKANPALLDGWLAGVKTVDDGEALPKVKASLGL